MKKLRKSNASKLVRNSDESLKIEATVYHVTREESYYLVEYRTVDGAKRPMLIGREQFRKPTGVVDILLKAHADLPDDEKKAIDEVKQAVRNRSKRTYNVTDRTGWEGDSFIYLTETFGELAGKLRHQGSSEIDPALGSQRGTPKAWREGLRRPCRYSDFLLFALSVPASGPLLDIIGEDEGSIFHLQPQSSASAVASSQTKTRSTSGKTLAARAGMSEIGRCRKTDLVTFAATERAVEDYCFAHNHLAGVFDEEGRALSTGRGVKISNLPYLVAGGVGTLRSRKATQDPDLQNLRWSVPVLSSGESPLDDPAKRAPRSEGAQARMIPVPVPPGARGGIFNRIEGSLSQRTKMGRHLARQVEKTISSNYGVLMPTYLAQLVPLRGELLGRVRGIIDEFVDEMHADQDPWERRFAEKFGIALAAALLMSEFGLAPWTKKRARIAIISVYKRARAASASPKEAADALLGRLRKLVRAGTRFPMVQKGQSLPPDQAKKAWGVIWKLPNSKRTILVPYDRLKRVVQPSAITNAVLRELAAREILLKADDGKLTRQVMIKGMTGNTKRRYVCLIRSGLMKKA